MSIPNHPSRNFIPTQQAQAQRATSSVEGGA